MMAYAGGRVNEFFKAPNWKAQKTMLVVAAALIGPNHTILIQKRPAGKALAGKWEFPGGKVDAGESCQAALVRELAEELGIAVHESDVEAFTFVTEARPGEDLVLLLFLCRTWSGEPVAREASALAWVPVTDLLSHDLAPLDIPLAQRLIDLLA